MGSDLIRVFAGVALHRRKRASPASLLVVLGLAVVLLAPASSPAQMTVSPDELHVGPNVVDFLPVAGETGVGTNTHVLVLFDRRVSTLSIEAIRLEREEWVPTEIGPRQMWVPVSTHGGMGGYQLLIREPESLLAPNTNYRVTLSPEIEDWDGRPLPPGDWSWQFRTGSGQKGPRVFFPRSADAGAWPFTTPYDDFEIYFDTKLHPDSLDAVSLERLDSPVGPAQISPQLRWYWPLYIRPADDLQNGGRYRVKIGTGLNSVEGVSMAAPWQTDFTAAHSPWIQSTNPSHDSMDVALDTDVEATFSVSMDPTTITPDSVYLVEVGVGAMKSADVSLGSDLRTVTISPHRSLKPSTKYQVWASGEPRSTVGMPYHVMHLNWASGEWYGEPFGFHSFATAAAPPPTTDTTTPTTDTTTPTTGPGAVSFSDVPTGHPHHDAIIGLAERDIVSGYGDGTFGPGDAVRRAQFAKMIVGSLGFAVTEDMTSPFTDFGVPDEPDDLYPHEYVACAYAEGITIGTSATTYSPWRNISRAQVVTMVVRTLKNEHPGLLETPPPVYKNTWGTGFSTDHGENSRIAEYNGLLEKLPLASTAKDPWAMMPRGEVAQILWNMIETVED